MNRDVLAGRLKSRALSPGGFDPARDIEAITVNRWPHGYAYGQDPETGEIAYQLDKIAPQKAPWIAARRCLLGSLWSCLISCS